MNKKLRLITISLIIITLLTFGLVACKKETLEKPTNIGLNGATVSWDEVENATSYLVKVKKDGVLYGEEAEVNTVFYELVFDKDVIGVFTIEVRAKNDKAISEPATIEYTRVKKLQTPVLTISGKDVNWSSVDGAVSYTLSIVNSKGVELYTQTNQELSFNLDESAKEEGDRKYSDVGEYTIKVVANSEENSIYENSEVASSKYYISTKLKAPEFRRFSNTSIYWTTVSNSQKYAVKVVAKSFDHPELVDEYEVGDVVAEYETTASSYSLDYMKLKYPGVYSVFFKTLGNNTVYLDSDWSVEDEEATITLVEQLSILDNDIHIIQDANKHYIMWKPVVNETNVEKYTVSLNAKKADGTSALNTVSNFVNKNDPENPNAEVFDGTYYKMCIDDMFYFIDEDDDITYKYSDENYYGRQYDISISVSNTEYNIISTQAVTVDEKYLSFKKPVQKFNESTTETEYIIETIGELAYMSIDPTGIYRINANTIDCAGYNLITIDNFSGKLYGDGCVIKNAVIGYNGNGDKIASFIGNLTGSIENVIFADVSNTKDDNVKYLSVIGKNNGSLINCTVSGSLSQDNAVVAGLVAINNSNILNCVSYANVEGNIAGGLVGIISQNNVNITNSYATGNVSAKAENVEEENISSYVSSGMVAAGGLVAIIDNLDIVTITNCFASGNVSAIGIDSSFDYAEKIYAGGLVGYAKNATLLTITKSYAGAKYSSNVKDRTEVIASGEKCVAGGFVGAVECDTQITACYASSRAKASGFSGGFIGLANSDSFEITACYATGATSNEGTKGAFVGSYTKDVTLDRVFYYSQFGESWINDEKATKFTLQSSELLYEKLTEALNGSDNYYASISNYSSVPVLNNVLYLQNTQVEAKPLENIESVAYYANGSEVIVINRNSEEGFEKIGDNSKKGYYSIVYSYSGQSLLMLVKVV